MQRSLIGFVGVALFIFGIAQFASVSSNPVLLQNLTAQGYQGVALYTAPPFLSAILIFVAGILLAYLFGAFTWTKLN